jgi:quinoprotein glucose dehydrogenase
MEYIRGTARAPGSVAAPAGGRGGGTGAEARSAGAARGGAAADGGEGEGGGARLTVQGLPLVKPPYGRITAIDLGKGEIVWQIAHGETPDAVRNHPALKGLRIPRTGRAPGRIGTLVTKTLVIAGEPGVFTTPGGARGAMLRAYDKATGAELGAVFMSAPQTGSPMTYMLNGRQYIVLATSGGTASGELVAYRLPAESIASR